MSFSLSGLSAYTDQSQLELLRKALLSQKTVSLVQKVPGVKSAKQLPILAGTVTFQAAGCGWGTGSSSTTISKRDVKVGSFDYKEGMCAKDLAAYFTQQELTAGAAQEEVPFEQQIADLKVALVAKELEIADWQAS